VITKHDTGNIYLGENFTAYVSVLNHLQGRQLLDVEITAKLQSPSRRDDLLDKRSARGGSLQQQQQHTNPAPVLSTGQNLDMIVEHTLAELGTHTLRVGVTYREAGAPLGDEPKVLRKFYRFQVLNPLEMSTTAVIVQGRPLIEVTVKNTTQMDQLLEACGTLLPQSFQISCHDRAMHGSSGSSACASRLYC
jgi:trafficking protein particle complex subunit 13